MPVSTFNSVDFPAPFSPSSACTSPGATSKSTQSLATTPPGKCFVICRIETAAAGATAVSFETVMCSHSADVSDAACVAGERS